jgi:threonine synthase
MGKGVLEEYGYYLPLSEKTPRITLGEGDTPLIKSIPLGEEIGCLELYFKLEGCNPTGSFKDRGMVVAAAKALEEGFQAIVCASTGNTSASASAYAAVLGLLSIIIIPQGKIALGKLSQAIIHGAKIVAIRGNFDAALGIVRELSARQKVALVNSINPNRIEGQKTAAFEIVDTLKDAPDYLFIPVGNAGNITAYWKGFKEYCDLGKARIKPRMMGFQAEGAAPIILGKPVINPETIATAIRIGNPASWRSAVIARDESNGIIDMVSDEEILAAYHLMAKDIGIFGEPASAASLAGLLKKKREGMDFKGKRIVCVVTGTGLKDTEIATRDIGSAIIEVRAELGSVEAALGYS